MLTKEAPVIDARLRGPTVGASRHVVIRLFEPLVGIAAFTRTTLTDQGLET